MQEITQVDRTLFLLINGLNGHWLIDELMRFLSYNRTWACIAAFFLAYCALARSRRLWVFFGLAAVAVIGSDLIAFRILKPFFARLRPCYSLETVMLIQESCGGRFGFPSNHASNSAAIALMIGLFWRRPQIAKSALVLAFLIGISRIYIGVHYPGDILFGWFVGALWSVVIWIVYLRCQQYRSQSLPVTSK